MSGASSPVSPAAAWFTLWALVATSLFAFVDRQVLSLVAAPMAQSLNLSNAQLGMILGLGFAIFAVAAAYPIAWLADRADRRLVLGLCVLVWACGTAACSQARNFHELLFASIAIAAGEAGLGPLALSVVPDLFKGQQRVTANLIVYIATVLGISLGLLLGGFAIKGLDAVHGQLPLALQSLQSWRLIFLLVAAPAPLFLVLVGFMHLRRPEPRISGGGAAVAPIGMGAFLRGHGLTLALIIGGSDLYMFAFAAMFAWVPATLSRLFGVQSGAIGIYIGAATSLGGIVGVVTASILMRRLRPKLGHRAALRVSWIALIFVVPIMLLYPFVTSAWQAYVLVAVQTSFGTLVGSLSPYMLQGMAPANLRTRILAIYTMVYGPIGGLSVLISGAVSDLIGGPRSLFWAMTIVGMPALVLAIMVFRAAERPFEQTATWIGVD